MLKVIGLTGNIGSGKSTVARMFAELGALLLSADKVAREIVLPGNPILHEIVKAFGKEILYKDGTLNRARLGEIVFNDPEKRKLLEDLTHPAILKRLADQIETSRKNPALKDRVLLVEIPLLFEVNACCLVDQIILVVTEQSIQVKRLMKRSGISRKQALLRIASQWPIDTKIKQSHWIIYNNRSLKITQMQVNRVWNELKNDGSISG